MKETAFELCNNNNSDNDDDDGLYLLDVFGTFLSDLYALTHLFFIGHQIQILLIYPFYR